MESNRVNNSSMEDQGAAGWHNVSGGRVRSLPNTSQGDCLFRALSHQLEGSILAPALRERAVNYMRDNLPDFFAQLLGLGWDMQESGEIPAGEYDPEELPIMVLNILRLQWTWGGAESIAALSRLLRRRIIVYQENAGSIHFNPIEEEQGPALRLLHRIGNNGRRTHYESVLNWMPERSTNIANPVEDEQPPCKVPRIQHGHEFHESPQLDAPVQMQQPPQLDAPVQMQQSPQLDAPVQMQQSPQLNAPAPMQLRPRARFAEDIFRSDDFSEPEGCDGAGADPIGFTCCLLCGRRFGRYGLIPCGHFPACGTCIRVRFLHNNNRCTRCDSQVIGWTKVFNQN